MQGRAAAPERWKPMTREHQKLAGRLEAWIDGTREAFLKDLMDLIRIPSVSAPQPGPDPYGAACTCVLEESVRIARRRGFAAHNYENRYVLLELPGRSEHTIGIFCHLDVVAAGTGWAGDPYAPVLRDGHVFGRGSTDNKGPAAAMLSLLDFLRQTEYPLEHTIQLFLGGSEENGMMDLDDYLARHTPPECSLIPDAQFSVCCGEKGHLTATVSLPLAGSLVSLEGGISSNAVPDTARAVLRCDPATLRTALGPDFPVTVTETGTAVEALGRSAHAATPAAGENAIVKLSRALLGTGVLDDGAAETLRRYSDLFGDFAGEGLGVACADAPSGALTAVGGCLRTVDGHLEQSLDIRYPVTADPNELNRRLADTLLRRGCAISAVSDSEPLYYPPDDPMIRMLNDTCNEILGTNLSPYVIGGGTYARKLPQAVAFGHLLRSRPRPGGAKKGGGHQVDECVFVQGLEDLMRVYLRALLRLDVLDADETTPASREC